jgi:hypothetical protein
MKLASLSPADLSFPDQNISGTRRGREGPHLKIRHSLDRIREVESKSVEEVRRVRGRVGKVKSLDSGFPVWKAVAACAIRPMKLAASQITARKHLAG